MKKYFVEKVRYYGVWVGEPGNGGWFDESGGKPRAIITEKEFDNLSEAEKYFESLTANYGKTYFDEIKLGRMDRNGDIIDYLDVKDPGDD